MQTLCSQSKPGTQSAATMQGGAAWVTIALAQAVWGALTPSSTGMQTVPARHALAEATKSLSPLMRPVATRFLYQALAVKVLQSLRLSISEVVHRRDIFDASAKRTAAKHKLLSDVKAIVGSDEFWMSVSLYVEITADFIKVLRIFDTGRPAHFLVLAVVDDITMNLSRIFGTSAYNSIPLKVCSCPC